jgi:hypothetical protein
MEIRMTEQSDGKDAPVVEAITSSEPRVVTDQIGEGELINCVDFDALHRAAKASEAKALSTAKPSTVDK